MSNCAISDSPDDARRTWGGHAPRRCAGADHHRHRLMRTLLAQAGDKLKLIANYGAGVDHIDVATARQRGDSGVKHPRCAYRGHGRHDPGPDPRSDPAHSRRAGRRCMRETGKAGRPPHSLAGGSAGGRLGILGMGRIGQAVARRARAFGMQIHYHNRKRLRPEIEADLEATYWESLDQMVSRMDVLSINCPHTPSTFHLMNARRLKLMKPSAVIVNTSRGEVIDENALTRMLRAGEIAGAGLDVYEHGTDINPRLREPAERGASAAYGIGDHGGPDRDGRKGHHQHQDLCRRPPPARSGRSGNVVTQAPWYAYAPTRAGALADDRAVHVHDFFAANAFSLIARARRRLCRSTSDAASRRCDECLAV
jgi:glyoxylate reductase